VNIKAMIHAELNRRLEKAEKEVAAARAAIAFFSGESPTPAKGNRKGRGWPKGKKRGPRKPVAEVQDEQAGTEAPAPQPKRESRPRVPGTPRPAAKGASLAQAAGEE